MKLETLNEMARVRYVVVSLHDNHPHFITDGDDEKEFKSATEVAKALEKNFGYKTEVRKIFAPKDRKFTPIKDITKIKKSVEAAL